MPRGHFSAPCDSGQGQGSSGHPPKGGSPCGHTVSAGRLAGSLLTPSSQDLANERQPRAADEAGKGSQAGLTNEEPRGRASVPLSVTCGYQWDLPPRTSEGLEQGTVPTGALFNLHSPQLHTDVQPVVV